MAAKHPVQILPSGVQGEIEEGASLLDAARALGVAVRSDCGGKGTCGKCRVCMVEGLPLADEATEFERRVLGDRLDAGYRLACQTLLHASVQFLVPDESRVEKTVILTDRGGRPLELDPMVQKYHLRIEPPSLKEPLGDAERLLETLRRTYGRRGVKIAYPVLRDLPRTVRDARWDVTITVWDWGKPTIVDIEPGYVDTSYGIAVDIGTTTVVGYLADLSSGRVMAVESVTNPQVTFGGDVLSRISYALEEEGGREQLRHIIVQALNRIAASVCVKAGIDPRRVAEMTVVGNTAMHHLFLGIDAEFIARSPFAPAIHAHCDLRAASLGLEINPMANVHVLPIEAGFVGADNVAALIATEPYNEKAVTLLIDIGTNGELVLGNQGLGLVACSVAAGPAFEGACIQFGMRAAAGAIEHVEIDPRTFGVRCDVIGDVPALGICGSGLIDATAEMLRSAVILPDGQLNPDLSSPRLRRGSHGKEFVLVWKDQTGLGEDIAITQQDVRSVQLAKGAFQAGTQILMKHLGVERVEKVLLAGAFGSYVSPEAAMTIGLIPQCELEKVYVVGNAAGHGALMALLSRRKRAEALRIARQVRYVELTADPDFRSNFVAGTCFPEPVS